MLEDEYIQYVYHYTATASVATSNVCVCTIEYVRELKYISLELYSNQGELRQKKGEEIPCKIRQRDQNKIMIRTYEYMARASHFDG